MKVKIGGVWVDKPQKFKSGGTWATKPTNVIGGTPPPPPTWTNVTPGEPAPYQVTPSAPYTGPSHAQLLAGAGSARMIEVSGSGTSGGMDNLSIRGPAAYSANDDYSGIAFLSGNGVAVDITNISLLGLNVGIRGYSGYSQSTTIRNSLIDGQRAGDLTANGGGNQLWVFGVLTQQIGTVSVIDTDFVNGGSARDPVGGNGGKNQSHRVYLSRQTPLWIQGCNFTNNIAGRDVQVYGDAIDPATGQTSTHIPAGWAIIDSFFDYHELNGYTSIQSNPLVESTFSNVHVKSNYVCIEAYGDIHMTNNCLLEGAGTGIFVMADNITLNLESVTNNCATPINLNGHTGVTILTGPPAPAVDTIIDTGPSGTTNDNTPTWTYHATNNDQAPTFQRSLDTGTPTWGASTALTTYTASTLADGSYTFRVRASDSRGVDPSPALRSITVQTSAATVNSLAAINTAIASAAPGATIYVANGTYGALNLNANKAAPGVTLEAQSPGSVTFAGVTVTGSGLNVNRMRFTAQATITPGATRMSFDHCLFSGGYYGLMCATVGTLTTDTRVTNNRFQGPFGEDAIRFDKCHSSNGGTTPGLLIEANEFTLNRETGQHNDSFQSVYGGDHIVFRQNYIHDNYAQGFFVKDQPATFVGITCENNLIVRNNGPNPPPGYGAFTPIQIFGPLSGLRVANNTIWGEGDNSFMAMRAPANYPDSVFTSNVIYRFWTDTTVGGTMSNNTVGTAPQGAWPAATGQINTPTPGFNNTAVDDYRILTGASAGRGVNWRPGDFHYGP